MLLDVMRRIRLIAMWTLSNPNWHQFAVDASMVLQLFRILERLVAAIAFEVFCVRMDFHVGVLQSRQYWRLEIAVGIRATIELKVDRMLAPQMRGQRIVNPFLGRLVSISFAFRASEFGVGVGGVMTLFMHRQHIIGRKSHGTIFNATFEW